MLHGLHSIIPFLPQLAGTIRSSTMLCRQSLSQPLDLTVLWSRMDCRRKEPSVCKRRLACPCLPFVRESTGALQSMITPQSRAVTSQILSLREAASHSDLEEKASFINGCMCEYTCECSVQFGVEKIILQLSQSNALYPRQNDQRILCFPCLGADYVVRDMECGYPWMLGNTSHYSEVRNLFLYRV